GMACRCANCLRMRRCATQAQQAHAQCQRECRKNTHLHRRRSQELRHKGFSSFEVYRTCLGGAILLLRYILSCDTGRLRMAAPCKIAMHCVEWTQDDVARSVRMR